MHIDDEKNYDNEEDCVHFGSMFASSQVLLTMPSYSLSRRINYGTTNYQSKLIISNSGLFVNLKDGCNGAHPIVPFNSQAGNRLYF